MFQNDKFSLSSKREPGIGVRVPSTDYLGVCKTISHKNICKKPSVLVSKIIGFVFQSTLESLRKPLQKFCCLFAKPLYGNLRVVYFGSIYSNQANRLAIVKYECISIDDASHAEWTSGRNGLNCRG